MSFLQDEHFSLPDQFYDLLIYAHGDDGVFYEKQENVFCGNAYEHALNGELSFFYSVRDDD